jgi:hypothetical protein
MMGMNISILLLRLGTEVVWKFSANRVLYLVRISVSASSLLLYGALQSAESSLLMIC